MSDCKGYGPGCRLCVPCANCGAQEDCSLCRGSMCRVHKGLPAWLTHWFTGLLLTAIGFALLILLTMGMIGCARGGPLGVSSSGPGQMVTFRDVSGAALDILPDGRASFAAAFDGTMCGRMSVNPPIREVEEGPRYSVSRAFVTDFFGPLLPGRQVTLPVYPSTVIDSFTVSEGWFTGTIVDADTIVGLGWVRIVGETTCGRDSLSRNVVLVRQQEVSP